MNDSRYKKKLLLMKERPKSTVLYLPTEFVKKAGFNPDKFYK